MGDFTFPEMRNIDGTLLDRSCEDGVLAEPIDAAISAAPRFMMIARPGWVYLAKYAGSCRRGWGRLPHKGFPGIVRSGG